MLVLLLAFALNPGVTQAEPSPLAQPSVTATNPAATVVGQPISVDAELTEGDNPSGTLTFRTYDPALPSCTTQPVVFSATVNVNGDGIYESPEYLTEAAGTYLWTVEYSGDANNEPATSTCNAAGSTSEVAKAQPTLTPTASTSGGLGDSITNSVDFSGRFSTAFSPDIEVTFAAYGPDDPDCSGNPAFTSYSGSVDADEVFTSLSFTPDSAGTYNWIASYTGDTNNEPFSTACGAAGSVSVVTNVGPFCPAIIYPFSVSTFKPNRKAMSPQVPGVRITLTTNLDIDAVIRPSYRYKVKGKVRTASLKQRSIRINGSRRLLFGIPSGMAKRLRKTTGQVSRNKVTFKVGATLRIHGAGPACEQTANDSLRTRISGVSRRNALRRIPSW